ncbi:MAG: rhodanese-like domain-containing protein [Deltaproteobacteria bacterium]
MKQFIAKCIRQSVGIVIIASCLAISINIIRVDSLPLISHTQQSDTISIKQAYGLYEKGKVIFVDTRDEWSFREMGHLPNALNIEPHSVDKAIDKLKNVSAGKTIITYCDGEKCQLSKTVAKMLKAKGFTSVKVIVDGWTQWRNSNLPIERNGNEK